MKKLTAILLTLGLLLSLTGCEDAISKLLYRNNDSQDAVQSKEPDIPGTGSPDGGASFVEFDPTAPIEPAAPAEPDVPSPETDGAHTGGEEGGENPDAAVTASHSDVSLFSAGETFTMSAQGVSGAYACSFVSADPEIAAVDEGTGVITAVSPGMTTVTMHVECGAGQFDFDCTVRCRWSAEEPELPDAGTDGTPAEETGAPVSETEPASSKQSLSGFFSTLQGKYEGLGAMMVFDSQLLDAYYPGLTGIAAVEEVLIQETAMSTANVAVGLVKLSDSATAEDILAVQSVMQGRISDQANGGAFYPASCETWESGVITSVSNCVGMFVYPDDAQAMASLFTTAFGN